MSQNIKNEVKKGPYFVMDMTDRWQKHRIIRGKRKPTIIYRTFLGAVKASHRLAKAHPDHHWAIFECLGYAVLETEKDPLSEPIANAA